MSIPNHILKIIKYGKTLEIKKSFYIRENNKGKCSSAHGNETSGKPLPKGYFTL